MTGPDRNDNQFEDYLAGNSRLSSLYRECKQDEVPPALDDIVMCAAHKAVRKNNWSWFNPFSSSWAVPVAFAAVMGLTVGLVMFVDQPVDNTDHVASAPAPVAESRTVAAKPANKPKRRVAIKTRRETGPSTPTLVTASSDTAGKRMQGADTAAVTVMNNEVMQDGARGGASSGAVHGPAPAITMAKAKSMTKPGGSLAFGRLAWLDQPSLKRHIIKLFDAGELNEAKLAFREYVRRYPKDDLKKSFGDRLQQLRMPEASETGKR
jgi:hypothetical protein